MDDELVKSIIIDEGNKARARQKEIKTRIYFTWVIILLILGVFAYNDYVRSLSVDRLTERIEQEDPITDYLRCHNQLKTNRDAAQSQYIFALIDYRSDTPDEATTLEQVREARENYRLAERRLTVGGNCPDFPSLSRDGPD